MGDDHTAHIQTYLLELATQTQHILVVCNTEVATHLILLDVDSADYGDNLGTVAQLREHTQLTIGQESRQDTASVVIIEEFTAKFEIELISKLADALLNLKFIVLPVLGAVCTQAAEYIFEKWDDNREDKKGYTFIKCITAAGLLIAFCIGVVLLLPQFPGLSSDVFGANFI